MLLTEWADGESSSSSVGDGTPSHWWSISVDT